MTISSIPIITDPTVAYQDIGVAVMAKSLDAATVAGQDMIKMMEQSINPYLGQNIDLRV